MWQIETSASLYRAAQVREFDRRSIERHGIPSAELMTRAGMAAFRVMRARFPRARRIACVCGPGNNGGDGYVVARLAKEAGLETTVVSLGDATRASPEAADMRARCAAHGIKVDALADTRLEDADLIVDALLGIGLQRDVKDDWRAAIEAMNRSHRPILSIDIPSGLHADTGAVLGAAVRAEATVSYIGLKAGLFTADGREQAGEIFLDDLGVPAAVFEGEAPLARRLTETELRGLIRRRPRNAHKGEFGHVLVVGGATGMPGAAELCGQAAARSGAGLVTLAVQQNTGSVAVPEMMRVAVPSGTRLKPLLQRATTLALGPGLSQSSWAQSLFRATLATKLPAVVDADALNLLARKPARRQDWILTPHPGEAARLLGITSAKVQQDRFDAVRKLVKRYGGVCVLKGSGTLIASSESEVAWLCDRGNAGMASGGMGDVLSGVIAGLYTQGLSALDAARLGVWLHATAGDIAAQQRGEIGLLASDLIPVMREELNRLAL